MTMIDITVLAGIICCVVAVLSFFAGAKKTSNAEISELAEFKGEVKATLQQLQRTVEKVDDKLTRFSSEIYDEINRQISEHEKRYHA